MISQGTTTTRPPAPTDLTDDDRDLLVSVRQRFLAATATAGTPLFTTDVSGLWERFLATIPRALRQTYTCHACRRFVEQYGSLVTIDEEGRAVSAVWENGPGVFEEAVAALRAAVGRARVNGVFLTQEKTLGMPVTGQWQHFAVAVPRHSQHKRTTYADIATLHEDYGILSRSLVEFSLAGVRTAVNLLEAGDSLYRGEKVLGVAKWFQALHEKRATNKSSRARENMVWLAVATAPPGYAHVRSSMIGTLLADIEEGLSFNTIKERFDAKMHPLQYQRPTAAPSGQQIAVAEGVVKQLGAAGSLARRFARREDVVALWAPKRTEAEAPADDGVFGHLRKKSEQPQTALVTAPPVVMTWAKFRDTILPEAGAIEFLVPYGNGPYIALTTAVDPDAAPILQWDEPEQRNPVGWYCYDNGASPQSFNLSPGTWCAVSTITLLPPMWKRAVPNAHWGEGALFLLEGARDKTYTKGGLFFPEQLRGEFYPVRKTLEAYAQSAVIAGRDEATACGLDLRKGGTWLKIRAVFRVTTRTGVKHVQLDRWD